MNKRKRILIDANPTIPVVYRGSHTGVGRTCVELIKALDNIASELPFDIELFTQNLRGCKADILQTIFKTHHLYLRNTEDFNRFSARFHLRELLTRYDLQHITHNYEIVADPSRCIVTVHDAMFMKEGIDTEYYREIRQKYPSFISSCRHIITCSECSKRDISETMNIDPDNITVIPWGIDHSIFHPDSDINKRREILTGFNIQRDYIMCVSCSPKRKRTEKLIEAYMKADHNYDLVLVWSNIPEDAEKLINGNPHIKVLKGVSDESLRHLYNGALATMFITSYEGFGLPILEAMACACPVVTCRNSSLPEVAGDAALYLDEPIDEPLVKFLNELDNNRNLLLYYKEPGIAQAKKFTWDRAARKTAEVYYNQLCSL